MIIIVLLSVIIALLLLLIRERQGRRRAYAQGYQDGLALGLKRHEAERAGAYQRGKRAAARELEDLIEREGGMSLSA
jgi:hypothetical protein